MTSDDRVRGGSSQSYLSVANPERAIFHGHLDTSTLGGAGFASQHSLGTLSLDLSGYEGILVTVAAPDGDTAADGKRYVLTLKNELKPRRDDGRERSSLTYEAEFVADDTGDYKLPWDAFKATYRGREKPDADPLDLKNIKRVGLMLRRYVCVGCVDVCANKCSFFDHQDGDFKLSMHAIAAYREERRDASFEDDLKGAATPKRGRPGWKSLLCGMAD